MVSLEFIQWKSLSKAALEISIAERIIVIPNYHWTNMWEAQLIKSMYIQRSAACKLAPYSNIITDFSYKLHKIR